MVKLPSAIRKTLPRGLLGRTLFILLAPLIFLQAVLGYVFYEYHIEEKLAQSANQISSEINYIRTVFEKHQETETFLQDFSLALGHEYIISLKNGHQSYCVTNSSYKKPARYDIIAHKFMQFLLRFEPDASFCFHRDAYDVYFIAIPLSGEKYLGLKINKKKILSSKWHFLPVWSLVTAIISALIAIIFLKNQIRPIIRLSQVLEAFGRGDDDCAFHPSGAIEIRKAGIEFLKMRRRLKEYITSRTMMLAGVSHDLRTIITRFKLELSFMPSTEETENLKSDVNHMTAILDAYFHFINTTETEESTLINISEEIKNFVQRHRNDNQTLNLKCNINHNIMLRKNGFFRCVLNLLSNAQRYGSVIHITVSLHDTKKNKFIRCIIEDNGRGVPENDYEKIFDPFYSDNISRTLSSNNAEQIGLGLSIARNIARTKGGDIIPTISETLGGLKMILLYAIE